MTKRWLLVTLYASLFGVFLYLKIAIWFLFLLLAAYNVYRIVSPPAPRVGPAVAAPTQYGTIGAYAVDGDPEDLSWGLYFQLCGSPVFVDIREDHLRHARAHNAAQLAATASELEQNLRTFLAANPDFANRRVLTIGLHSEDPTRGEVFWDPDGYTVLWGNKFVKDVPGAV